MFFRCFGFSLFRGGFRCFVVVGFGSFGFSFFWFFEMVVSWVVGSFFVVLVFRDSGFVGGGVWFFRYFGFSR